MKISKILLVLLAVLTIVSCKSDDDGPLPFLYNQANLLGVYEINYFLATETETTNVNGLDIVTVTTTTGDTFEIDVTFLQDGTYVSDGAFRQMYTVVVAGQTVESDSNIVIVDNEIENYTVISASNVLTLAGENYQVSDFSETGMTITLETIETDMNGDTFVLNEELRFNKI